MTDYFRIFIAEMVKEAGGELVREYEAYCKETKGIARYASEWAANKTLLDGDRTYRARGNVLDGDLGILLNRIDESLPEELAGLKSAATTGQDGRTAIVLVPV